MDKSFWRGTLILTISAFIIKILSAVYRLPYQNLAGDVGFYVYQQVYPFYALASVMGGFGFPVVLSKIIAESKQSDESRRQSIYKMAYVTLSALGIVLFFALFFGAPFIAGMMGDHQLQGTIRIISFIFLFMPTLAWFRGYFQGTFYNMLPTGVSQVTEQTVRVGFILGVSLFLYQHGAGPYAFGGAAAFGSMIAPAFAVTVLALFFLKWSKQRNHHTIKGQWDKSIIKQLLVQGIAYTVTALSLVFFQLSDGLTLVPLLTDHHYIDGKTLKGIYDRSYPLIQMGMTAAVAIATAIIPTVARLWEGQEITELRLHIKQTLKLVILFAGAASIGLFSIIKETNIMLFENSNGTTAIAIMVLSILAASIVITGTSMLQGVGYIYLPVIYLLFAFILKTILNYILVPSLGIVGAAIATVISVFTLAILVYLKLVKVYQIQLFHKKEWIKVSIVFGILLITVMAWRALFSFCLGGHIVGRIEAASVALTSVGIGGVIFFILILRMSLFSWEEVEQLPGGRRLSAIFKRN